MDRFAGPAPEHEREIDRVAADVDRDRGAEDRHELEQRVDVGSAVGDRLRRAGHDPVDIAVEEVPGIGDAKQRQKQGHGPESGSETLEPNLIWCGFNPLSQNNPPMTAVLASPMHVPSPEFHIALRVLHVTFA